MSKEKYYCDCYDCKVRYRLIPANTVLYVFSDRLYCSYAESMCDCGEDTRNFVDPDELKEMRRQRFPTVPVATTPPFVVKQWEELNDTKLLEPLPLTPRHEELLESLRVMLELTPDEHLMDIFSSPPPKSNLPLDWV